MNYIDNSISISKNGFIVSDPTAKVRSESIRSQRITDKHSIPQIPKTEIINAAKASFNEYTECADKANKSFFKLLISSFAVIACFIFFFKTFTIGTVVFSDGRHIASAASQESYETALGIAKKRFKNSEDIKNIDFNVFPALLLRTKTIPPNEISNRILLTLPEFENAYTLFSDGKAVYSAKSEKEAKEVLLSYVNEYSMNGKAEISSDIAIKKSVLEKKKINSFDDCLKILKESNCVNVISVVNSTVQEAVPYETTTQTDDTLYIGEKVTVTKGISGKKEVSQQIIYQNGTEQSSEIHSEKIIVQPVSEIVKVGTKSKNILETGVIWPLSEKGIVSSRFGKRWGKNHEGLDIAIEENTAVIAAECGIVTYTSENAGGYGKYIKINHGNGMETAYAHLNKIEVTNGQAVKAGERIALSGNTGRSTGPHLHFEIVKNGEQINPEPYIK